MKLRPFFIKILFYFGYIFLYAPILLIVLYSFNKSPNLSWQGFSFHWYKTLWQDTVLWQSAQISIKIALASASLAVLLGLFCAHSWSKIPQKNKILGFLSTLPLVIPELILGLSILMLFVWMDRMFSWPKRGFLSVITAHTTLGSAYVTAILRARLASLDPTLTEAALDLGARPKHVFFLIKMPLIFPALLASWIIVFIVSFDDVVLASFTSGPGTTPLPLRIFSSLKVGYTPKLTALASCIVLMVSFFIIVIGCIFSRKEQK